MTGWRQIHEDGSQSVILRNGHTWQIKLVLSGANGHTNYVGLMTSDLEEAKAICRRVLQNEISHHCTKFCQDWEIC